jgi:hypothetical protein
LHYKYTLLYCTTTVVGQAHVRVLHNCTVYCLVQNSVLCTLIGCFHVLAERRGSFLYLNLNIFASKYSPIYESEVSKAPQSMTPTKDCKYDIFLLKRQSESHGRFHHNDFSRYTGRGTTTLTT